MAKYVSKNFIVDSSAAFYRNVSFDSSVFMKGQLRINAPATISASEPFILALETGVGTNLEVKSIQAGTMAFEDVAIWDASLSSIKLVNSSQDASIVALQNATIEAWNGLTKTDNSIGLGGTLNNDTNINIGNNEIQFGSSGSSQFVIKGDEYADLAINDGSYGTDIYLEPSSLIINAINQNTGSGGSIEFNTTDIIIDVSGTFQYRDDYSSNYVDRSLVDKAYVDAQASGAEAWNGLTKTDSSIGLGGTLTQASSVALDGNTLAFTDTSTLVDIQSNQVRIGDFTTYSWYNMFSHPDETTTPLMFGGYKDNGTSNQGYDIGVYLSNAGNYSTGTIDVRNAANNSAAMELRGDDSSANHYILFDLYTAGSNRKRLEFTSVGLELQNGVSSLWGANHLITKGYADATYASASASANAWNGLTKTDSSIGLGGLVHTNVEIDVSDNYIAIGELIDWNNYLEMDKDSFSVYQGKQRFYVQDIATPGSQSMALGYTDTANNRGQQIQVFQDSQLALFNYPNASTNHSYIYLNTGSIDFYAMNSAGTPHSLSLGDNALVYSADYSSNYTDRSLVDKAYVDSQAGGANAWNGLTKTDSSIGLGGALTQFTNVTGVDNGFRFSGTNSQYSFYDNYVEFNINDSGSGLVYDYARANGASSSKEIEVYDGTNDAYFTQSPTSYEWTNSNGSISNTMTYNVTSLALNFNSANTLTIDTSGARYGTDMSPWYTDRTLVDRGYVKSYVDGSLAASGANAWNGLTKTDSSIGLGGTLTQTTNIVTNGNDFSVTGDFQVIGDFTVDGSITYINSVNLDVSDNIITINSGETGSVVTAGYAGIKVDRGSSNPYMLVFEESSDTFRIGIGTESGLPTGTQAVATREDSPNSEGIPFWNNTANRFDTVSDFTFNATSGLSIADLITASAGLTLTGLNASTNTYALMAPATAGGEITTRNISVIDNQMVSGATGLDILSNKTDEVAYFKKIVQGTGTTITEDSSTITISVTGAAGYVSKYTGTFNGSSDTSLNITAGTHGLGVGPLSVTVYDGVDQVFPDVANAANGDITLEWSSGSLGASCKYIITG